ncbi:MAG: hypothetical protein WKF43_06600 [Acidimicrobiales bacterium]
MSLLDASSSPHGGSDADGSEGIAALERIELELAGVEQALVRLDGGTYGRCEVCAEPIADEDLAGDPLVLVCAAHLDVFGAPVE